MKMHPHHTSPSINHTILLSLTSFVALESVPLSYPFASLHPKKTVLREEF